MSEQIEQNELYETSLNPQSVERVKELTSKYSIDALVNTKQISKCKSCNKYHINKYYKGRWIRFPNCEKCYRNNRSRNYYTFSDLS